MYKIHIIIISCTFTLSANAHPGGLNAEGCHTNRKTGEYHCHRSTTSNSFSSFSNNFSSNKNSDLKSQTSEITRPFRNCTEARLAGAAPVRYGEPGYGFHLDRDRDGIGCE